MARIHPTAIVDTGARLGEGVEIGAYCVVEADVEIGAGTVLRPHAVIRRFTTMGEGNFVDSHTVLGGDPQDLKFDPRTRSFLRIGDRNVFRECVTISRATGEGKETGVGSGTYWMAYSHAGHNAVVEDNVILVNGAAVAGHAVIGRRTILSENVGVHQFTWIGESVMTQGLSGFSAHVPPFTLCGGGINRVVGLNAVGLKRAKDITEKDRQELKEAFRLTYRAALPRREALAQMDAHAEWGGPAGRFRDFVRRVHEAPPPYNRPLCALGRARGGTA